jgi:hypothetical protein
VTDHVSKTNYSYLVVLFLCGGLVHACVIIKYMVWNIMEYHIVGVNYLNLHLWNTIQYQMTPLREEALTLTNVDKVVLKLLF